MIISSSGGASQGNSQEVLQAAVGLTWLLVTQTGQDEAGLPPRSPSAATSKTPAFNGGSYRPPTSGHHRFTVAAAEAFFFWTADLRSRDRSAPEVADPPALSQLHCLQGHEQPDPNKNVSRKHVSKKILIQ